MQPDPIVVVGSGLAGYTMVREFRKLDAGSPILLLSRDDGGFYSKPMLSNAMAMNKTPDALLNADAAKMAERLDIEIRPNTQVMSLEPGRRALLLRDGRELRYGRLVLAVGADPIRLPLSGEGAQHVVSVNDLDDYRGFREVLGTKSVVVILGAGLIGCEFANDLVGSGHEVHVVDISDQPLSRFLPEALGLYLRQKLEAAGVIFHLNAHVRHVDAVAGRLRLTVDEGPTIVGDVVLSAVGLRPRTQLAKAAGLEINRGIVVDRLLRTRDENIFALGDCAEVEGHVLPFVMPIMHAGRALAATLAGTPTPVRYPAMPVSVKLPACPAVIALPPTSGEGDWSVQTEDSGVRALFQNANGDLLGYVLLGDAGQDKAKLTAQLPPVIP